MCHSEVMFMHKISFFVTFFVELLPYSMLNPIPGEVCKFAHPYLDVSKAQAPQIFFLLISSYWTSSVKIWGV